MVSENTSIRNAKEEQHLFNRQVSNIEPAEVVRVETPNSHGGEPHVPHHEDCAYQDNSGEKAFPSLMKLDLGMKGIDKRDDDSEKIYQ